MGRRAGLKNGTDAAAIKAIRKAGGDVTVSFGGAGGAKLGEKCSTSTALAAAYQKVIDAYALHSIDIDLESTEFTRATVRKRVVGALKTVKKNNPGLKVYVTFTTGTDGPGTNGTDLIRRAAAAHLTVDAWTVMPFDFEQGTTDTDMPAATESSVNALKDIVAHAYDVSSSTAYRHTGFSAMNGTTDSTGETVTVAGFRKMLTYATKHHLARVSVWSVNRDRACAEATTDADACSGIAQTAYAFTKALAGYTG